MRNAVNAEDAMFGRIINDKKYWSKDHVNRVLQDSTRAEKRPSPKKNIQDLLITCTMQEKVETFDENPSNATPWN